MSKDCTTTKQGYPSIHNMKDCQLSHTGFDLLPLVLGAVVILSLGLVLRVVGKRRA